MIRSTLDAGTLEGRALDYAVTLALGWVVAERPAHWKCSATFAFFKDADDLCPTCSVPHYSEPYEGEKVMRLIQEHKIDLAACDDGTWNAWCPDSVFFQCETNGPTPAVAALRAFVLAKLGKRVQCPETPVP